MRTAQKNSSFFKRILEIVDHSFYQLSQKVL